MALGLVPRTKAACTHLYGTPIARTLVPSSDHLVHCTLVALGQTCRHKHQHEQRWIHPHPPSLLRTPFSFSPCSACHSTESSFSACIESPAPELFPNQPGPATPSLPQRQSEHLLWTRYGSGQKRKGFWEETVSTVDGLPSCTTAGFSPLFILWCWD